MSEGIYQNARKKLRKNLLAGMGLTVVVLLVWVCIYLTSYMAFAPVTALPDLYAPAANAGGIFLKSLVTAGILLLILSPLRLSIKSWYQKMHGERASIGEAFCYFSGFKAYGNALFFCLVRLLVLFFSILVPLLPSILLLGVLRFGLRQESSLGLAYATIALTAAVLFVIGLVFSLYLTAGFFYADYIYVEQVTDTPLQALRLSRKIFKNNKRCLFSVWIRILPWGLLCLAIITIPFVLPRIKSILAVCTGEIIDNYFSVSKNTRLFKKTARQEHKS